MPESVLRAVDSGMTQPLPLSCRHSHFSAEDLNHLVKMPIPMPVCFQNHHYSGLRCVPLVLSFSTNVSLVPTVLQAQGLD